MMVHPHPTRRGVLGAMAALPAVAMTATVAVEPSSWAAAVQKWRGLRQAFNAHPYANGGGDYLEGEADALLKRECGALDAVIQTRVPDRVALVEKLKIIKAELCDDDWWVDELISDVRALR